MGIEGLEAISRESAQSAHSELGRGCSKQILAALTQVTENPVRGTALSHLPSPREAPCCLPESGGKWPQILGLCPLSSGFRS